MARPGTTLLLPLFLLLLLATGRAGDDGEDSETSEPKDQVPLEEKVGRMGSGHDGGDSGGHGGGHGEEEGGHGGGHHGGISVASWRWYPSAGEANLGGMFEFNLILVLAILVKAFYHNIPYLSKYLPESCFLIFLGFIFGVIGKYILKIEFCDTMQYPVQFGANLFFFILLPPIILGE